MVLGSNRRKHWVSGRAVYALRTNGNSSVIIQGGGGWGVRRYDGASHQSRQAGREADVTQGRSYSLSILPTSLTRTSVWESRREGDRWDVMRTWLRSGNALIKMHQPRCRSIYWTLYSYFSSVFVVCSYCQCVYICLFMYECVSDCAAPAQSSDSLHGDRGPTEIWYLRAKESRMLSVGS